MECPVIDCAQAEEALQALAEMEAYLEAMGYSLGLAGDDAMRHFESIVETNVGTGESAAALQTNLGYQKFFHDMGSMLLDIASLTSFTKDLLEKPLSEQGPGELLQENGSASCRERVCQYV